MATAEEILLAEATEDTIVIDSDLRTINIPSTIKLLGVESDKDVKRLYFRMPATYGEVDLSSFDIRINYLNAKTKGDVYPVTDKAVADGNITFSWLVGKFALQYKGSVKFIVCLREMDEEGVVQRELNTSPAYLDVLEGLETTAQIAQDYPDIIEMVLKKLDEVEGMTEEQVTQLIKDYLEENPVQGPAGEDGVSVTHSWNGTTLTITSSSGTDSVDLKGDTGETGPAGADGQNGAAGKSAYAYAREGGYTGTEADFASIMAKLATIQVYNGEKEEI